MYNEQIITLNDQVALNYIHIPSSGCPIVLLHGIASEWQSFLPVIPVLAREFQVYAIDLRGHGKSSWVSEKYRFMDYARDVQNFLDMLVRGPAILYGHSLGAQVAIAVAAQSGQVHALVLGDPPLYYRNMTLKESIWHESFIELHHVISSMHSIQEIDEYMAMHYPNMDPQRRRARAETLSHVDPSAVATLLAHRQMDGYDLDALLKQITCPVLFIQGNSILGSALREEDVTYMLERLHHCEIVQMQDVGHGLPSGESLARVEDFLKRCLNPPLI